MIDVALQRTGIPVAYIELSTVALSLISNIEARLTCAVFFDKEDGYLFGRLLARELLYTFVQVRFSSFFTCQCAR
jgi:hypothetical protein